MAALVIIINMDKKNYKKIEKLIDARTRHGTVLTIKSCRECDGISRECKKKDWSKKGLASVKWAQRKSHLLLTEASPKQVRPWDAAGAQNLVILQRNAPPNPNP